MKGLRGLDSHCFANNLRQKHFFLTAEAPLRLMQMISSLPAPALRESRLQCRHCSRTLRPSRGKNQQGFLMLLWCCLQARLSTTCWQLQVSIIFLFADLKLKPVPGPGENYHDGSWCSCRRTQMLQYLGQSRRSSVLGKAVSCIKQGRLL